MNMDIDSARRHLESGSTADRSRALSWVRDCALDPDAARSLGPFIEQSLHHGDALIRAEAAETLSRPEFAIWQPALLDVVLTDSDALARATAAESLGDAGEATALPALRRAIEDDDAVVRGYAAASIGLLGNLDDAHLLLAHLVNEHSSSRFDFLAAVCRLDDRPESFARLDAALDTMSDEDAFRALNVVEDMLSRKVPLCVGRARETFLATLSRLADRLDGLHRVQIQRLRDRVESLPE